MDRPHREILRLLLVAALARQGAPGSDRREPPDLRAPVLARTGTAAHRAAVSAFADRVRKATPPAITQRERQEALDWMTAANPAIRHTLTGHRTIVLATDAFAQRAREYDLILRLDLAYEVLRDWTGADPVARAGRRFVFFPDPAKPAGRSCNGRQLFVHLGRSVAEDAGAFDDFVHEMFHGFQFEHPAGSFMCGGFFEGWAQFAQAVVADALSPLDDALRARFVSYGNLFSESARQEYLSTRLPIEEIVAYDPSAAVLMELVRTTLDARGRPDWTPLRAWLRGALDERPWVPWDLWPALFAREALRRFDPVKARPILASYRFPLDAASLDAVESILRGERVPVFQSRVALRNWSAEGPFPMEDPFGLDDGAEGAPASAPAAGLPSVAVDERGLVRGTEPVGGEPRLWILTCQLPAAARGAITLTLASAGGVVLTLDGEVVHAFRGERPCDPDHPDVVHAVVKGPGRLRAVLAAGPAGAAFHAATAPGGLFFEGIDERIGSKDDAEREAAAKYLGSRRVRSATRDRLLTLLADRSPRVREAAARGLGRHRDDPGVVEALLAAFTSEKDLTAKHAIQASLEELTFEAFSNPTDAERWWRARRDAFDASSFVEAEDSFALGAVHGGFFGNRPGAFGGQCVARGWGSERTHRLAVPLTARRGGPLELRLRHAGPASLLEVRLRRGGVVTGPLSLALPASSGWTWSTLPLPPLSPGRHVVEFTNATAPVEIDVMGFRPPLTTGR